MTETLVTIERLENGFVLRGARSGIANSLHEALVLAGKILNGVDAPIRAQVGYDVAYMEKYSGVIGTGKGPI